MQLLVAVLAVMLVSIPLQASADVSSEGSVTFDFSAFYSPTHDAIPHPYFYGWSENYFGSLNYYNPSTTTYSYPWDPSGFVYLNGTTYTGHYTDQGNVLDGAWDPDTGNGQLHFNAHTPQPGVLQSMIGIGVGNPYRFLGPYVTLPSFSYAYEFSGSKDNAEDQLSNAIQIEIGYLSTDGKDEYHMYSDYGQFQYGNYTAPFRSNWVWLFSPTNDQLLGWTENGTKTFSNLTTLDGQPHQWFIEYGMGISGIDTASPNAVTPEPVSTSLFLLGAGALWMKRRKK